MDNASPGTPMRVVPDPVTVNPMAALALRIDALAVIAATVAIAAISMLAAATPIAEAATISKTNGGGAVAGKLPATPDTVPGLRAKITRKGLAVPPAGAPEEVKAVIRAGNRIARKPYKWGGGHGRLRDSGYDCSGSISFALRKAKLLSYSMASTGFMSWGRRGRGDWITIRANAGHAYMIVAGLRFDTSARKQTGSRWTAKMRSPRGFRATHPVGF